MPILVTVFAVLVAVEHVWFGILEMVFWTKPLGLKTFGRTQAQADESKTLAMNQGLYNLFLSAGLVWGLLAAEPQAHSIKIFFFACVVVAGVFGGITVNGKILVVQAGPAAVGLALTLASGV